jgi:hypothetical protein
MTAESEAVGVSRFRTWRFTSMKLMRLLDRLFRQFGDRGPGFEPEVGVRVPKVFSPGGRGAAVAVREPEPDVFVDAVSRSDRSAGRSRR